MGLKKGHPKGKNHPNWRGGISLNRKEYQKKWHQKNSEYRKKYNKEYYQNNFEKYKEHCKKWARENKEQRKEYQRRYVKTRRRVDSKFRLDGNMGIGIWKALKKVKIKRKWQKLVGYTVDELRIHLESKFESWMNWNNYGKWEVDHIKPKSLFHYENAEDPEFKKCWALENLQPLEKIMNIKKGNKYNRCI